MLSGHEQRVWDDIQRAWDAEAEEPVRSWPHPATERGLYWADVDCAGVDDLPTAVVAGVWITIVLVIFGAPVAGLAVAGATALVWLLSRHRTRSDDAASAAAQPSAGGDRGIGGEADRLREGER